MAFSSSLTFHLKKGHEQNKAASLMFPSESRVKSAGAPLSDAIRGRSTNPGGCRARRTHREEHTHNRTHTQRATQNASVSAAQTWKWRAPEPSVFVTSVRLHTHTNRHMHMDTRVGLHTSSIYWKCRRSMDTQTDEARPPITRENNMK